MSIWTPDYYKEFNCDPIRCKHNCCIGWEIGIDEETVGKYEKISGSLSDKLHKCILTSEEGSTFILDAKKRCPFLNENNLCEIILEYGEEMLCDICRDHPRFKNFYEGREEIGVGIACEVAGELILSKKTKTKLVCLDKEKESLTEEEATFIDLRNAVFEICTDRSKSLENRIKKLLDMFETEIPNGCFSYWKKFYLTLENLEPEWLEILKKTECDIAFSEIHFEEADSFEQLLIYFIFRHLTDALDDGMYKERIKFCVLSICMIKALYDSGDKTFENLVELSRMYSSEIEYSDENVCNILYELT